MRENGYISRSKIPINLIYKNAAMKCRPFCCCIFSCSYTNEMEQEREKPSDPSPG